ncbi:hypothetical protein [Methylomonas albis]|uniref:Uncharacterized protein n=1 Tax=Methylomonas albis TaxID=1854563 RepID=A0ABR9CZ55_9GAMM|nr:hypothetical protein [Methylomonas albis]MBD9356010.1 hypothetical protein [Methylomonas albis]
MPKFIVTPIDIGLIETVADQLIQKTAPTYTLTIQPSAELKAVANEYAIGT